MSDTSTAMGEQVLLALGLDTVCVQVYLTMHAAPDADTVEIAQRLNLPISEVIDALDELADLTLLRPGLAPSGRLRPVSIERALHTLLRQQSEQLKAQTNALSQLQSAVTELLASGRPARTHRSRRCRDDHRGRDDPAAARGTRPAGQGEHLLDPPRRPAAPRGARGRETVRRGTRGTWHPGSSHLPELHQGRPPEHGVRAVAEQPWSGYPLRTDDPGAHPADRQRDGCARTPPGARCPTRCS